jgi:thiamine biosynthesis lipoprotein
LFDPTILRALEDAGYDRDFDEVSKVDSHRQARTKTSQQLATTAVTLDGNTVRLAPAAGLDFGGIAKGWTADLAADAAASVLGWAMIDAGGDMRLSPGSEGIVVAIEDPQCLGGAITHLTLESGALATTSTLRRRWGADRHHIIDPRTALPSRTGVVQATAWGATCVEAEVNAKWALLAGRPVLARIGALLVMEGGEVITNLRCGTAPQKASA